MHVSKLTAIGSLAALLLPLGILAGDAPSSSSAGDQGFRGDDVQAGQASSALKIGVLLPFTGALSDFGPPLENAARLAAMHVNDAGGVNGQSIEIVTGETRR